MDGFSPVRAENPSPCSAWRALWLFVLLGLVAGQTWLTLDLFGSDPIAALRGDQAILSGRHPLHLYHGALGSRAFLDHGTLCAFDPSFQAGYPKTPVFDGASRPAELFLMLAGGGYQPAAYKIGLATVFSLLPFFLALAARGAGLGPASSCISAALGTVVCWSGPCRDALDAGDLDVLFGSISVAVHVGLLLAYHRQPSLGNWVGLLLSAGFGLFAQPMLFLLLLPLFLIYYLSVGHHHRLFWHFGLATALGAALLANLFWLTDWVAYWWLRAPLPVGIPELSHRTFQTIWNAGFWGEPADRAFATCLFGAALVGLSILHHTGQRCAARLLGVAFVGNLLLAIAGIGWEPLGRLGTRHLLLSALLCAVPAAVHGGVQSLNLVARYAGCRWLGAAVGLCLLAAGVLLGDDYVRTYVGRWATPTPLPLVLGSDREQLVQELTERTTPTARILWEDRPEARQVEHWTALLPVLTGRSYVGGLDPDVVIDHCYASFRDQMLAGRTLAEWSDADLEDFCSRYNIGWVVCWTPAASARFQAWNAAAPVCPLHDDGPGILFAIQRAQSFALKGQAQWLQADTEHIVLGDVVPDDGKVVLSLHYQTGMHASPGRVQVERELDPFDPISFVRLKVSGPVARVTLTWDKRR
jgi:hypothetical protein